MERLQRDPERGCLIFQGATYNGVAYLRVPGGPVKKLARIVYEHAHGPIHRRVTVHQTCGNAACGELSHLEARAIRDAIVTGAHNGAKEACRHGHAFTEENTYRDPAGRRRCRICIRERHQEWRARSREVARGPCI